MIYSQRKALSTELNGTTSQRSGVSLKISYAGRTYFNKEEVGGDRATGNTFTIPLANLPTGYVYNCLITARYQMTTVSYPFTIYLTD